MAVLNFELTDVDNEIIKPQSIVSYELSKDVDAVCDGLRLYFASDTVLPQIVKVAAYCDNELIFNGFADTQRSTVDDTGYLYFLYARSSACILIDNEAKPYTYHNPSALSLYVQNARDFGFDIDLPKIYATADYQVSKGTSCYAAVNDFVYGVTGKNICVNANNVITLFDDNKMAQISTNVIESEKHIINRGGVLSRIDYKIDSTNDYIYHIKSRYMEDIGINCSKKINLSALPAWQRDYTLMSKLKSSASSFDAIELVVSDNVNFDLYSKLQYSSNFPGNISDYYISSVCLIYDDNGIRTKLMLNKNIDLKEIRYVDK